MNHKAQKSCVAQAEGASMAQGNSVNLRVTIDCICQITSQLQKCSQQPVICAKLSLWKNKRVKYTLLRQKRLIRFHLMKIKPWIYITALLHTAFTLIFGPYLICRLVSIAKINYTRMICRLYTVSILEDVYKYRINVCSVFQYNINIKLYWFQHFTLPICY